MRTSLNSEQRHAEKKVSHESKAGRPNDEEEGAPSIRNRKASAGLEFASSERNLKESDLAQVLN